MLVYIFVISSHEGQEEPMVFKSLDEAKNALKERYEEDLDDYDEEVMDNDLYDDSAYIELMDNIIYYEIYGVEIK